MNVATLKKLIADMPDDTEVVVQRQNRTFDLASVAVRNVEEVDCDNIFEYRGEEQRASSRSVIKRVLVIS